MPPGRKGEGWGRGAAAGRGGAGSGCAGPKAVGRGDAGRRLAPGRRGPPPAWAARGVCGAADPARILLPRLPRYRVHGCLYCVQHDVRVAI